MFPLNLSVLLTSDNLFHNSKAMVLVAIVSLEESLETNLDTCTQLPPLKLFPLYWDVVVVQLHLTFSFLLFHFYL